MDDQVFDSVVRSVAAGSNRRHMLNGLLGLAVESLVATSLADGTDAVRRGYAGPLPPKRPEAPLPSPACDGGTGGCTADGCCICRNSDRFTSYWARFSSCYNDQSFCGNRTGQTCCEFCAGWADESCTAN